MALLLHVLLGAAGAAPDSSIGPSAAAGSSVVVNVGGGAYRVQALSPTLLRIETEGPRGGFENRSTFFARNRSWPGVPITVRANSPNTSTLSTPGWTLELSPSAPDHVAEDMIAEGAAHARAVADDIDDDAPPDF